MEIEREKCWI